MTWVAAHMSVRGEGHKKTGLPCQDATEACLLDDGSWIVGVVCDGGGSLTRSDIGSSLAARYTGAIMSYLIKAGHFDLLDNESCTAIWRQLIEDVRLQIAFEARLTQYERRQFGTTLIAFAATREAMSAMQIGDGFLVYAVSPEVPSGGHEYKAAFEPRPGEYVGEVTWLTSSSWEEDFRCMTVAGPIDFICASSDGLEKVAIVQRSNTPFPRFFDPLLQQASGASDCQAMMNVVDSVLKMPALDRFTDDDKSMILARWSGG